MTEIKLDGELYVVKNHAIDPSERRHCIFCGSPLQIPTCGFCNDDGKMLLPLEPKEVIGWHERFAKEHKALLVPIALYNYYQDWLKWYKEEAEKYYASQENQKD